MVLLLHYVFFEPSAWYFYQTPYQEEFSTPVDQTRYLAIGTHPFPVWDFVGAGGVLRISSYQ